MGPKRTIAIFLITFFSLENPLWAKALSFADIEHSQITLTPAISALTMVGENVWQVPPYGDFFISAKYTPNNKDFPFGSIKSDTDFTQRYKLPKSIGKGFWQGLLSWKNSLLVIEGRKSKVFRYSYNGQYSLFSDIILDLFKPAADTRGEPTKREIRNSRRRFTQSNTTLGSNQLRIVGSINLPKSMGGNQDTFLILTRIPGFPLFTMYCDERDGLTCRLQRQCFIEGLTRTEQKSSHGLALSEKRREIYIGNESNKTIHGFKYYSCHHIAKSNTWQIPSKIKGLLSMFIDKSDNLWLSSDRPDDYLNASVYKWPAEKW